MFKDKKLLLIILIAIFLRFLPLLSAFTFGTTDALYDGDSGGYITMGEAFSKFDFLFISEETKDVSLVRTPGYPTFLGILYLFGFDDFGVVVIQILLDICSLLLIWKITERLFNKNAAYTSAALYALSPLFLIFSFKILTEGLFVFLFLASSFFLINYLQNNKKSHLFLAGILIAVAIIVRPVAIPFPFLYALAIFVIKKDMRSTTEFLLLSYSLTALWTVRNYFVFDDFIFSGIGDVTYLCWHGPVVVDDPGLNFEKWGSFIEEYSLDNPDVCANMEYEKIKQGKGNLTAMILERPFNYAKSVAIGGVLLFSPVTPMHIFKTFGMESPHFGSLILEEGFNLDKIFSALFDNIEYLILFSLFSLYQILIYLLAIYALWKGRNDRKILGLLAIIILITGYLVVIGGPVNMYSGYRYRIPLEPFLLVLAGSAFMEVSKWLKKKQ